MISKYVDHLFVSDRQGNLITKDICFHTRKKVVSLDCSTSFAPREQESDCPSTTMLTCRDEIKNDREGVRDENINDA